MRQIKDHPLSALLALILRAAAAATMLILGFLLAYILARGVPNLRLSMFLPVYTSDNQSMLPALVNTCAMTALSLLLAAPAGIGAAAYLCEYAPRGGWLVPLVRVAAQTLSGVPSIVYGLFGMLLFSNALGLGYSMLSGALTMAVMTLPLILRTAEEAMRAVPDAYREGSLALGAGRLRTTARVVLPAAMPGILSGVVLAVGRVVGETAALIYTSGTVERIAGLLDSGGTLALHLYRQASEGIYAEEAYATGAVLLALTLVLNLASRALGARLGKTGEGRSRGNRHEEFV